MIRGTVNFFDAVKDYGHVTPKRGGPDAFVSRSAMVIAGITELIKNDRVRYDLAIDRHGKLLAINLERA